MRIAVGILDPSGIDQTWTEKLTLPSDTVERAIGPIYRVACSKQWLVTGEPTRDLLVVDGRIDGTLDSSYASRLVVQGSDEWGWLSKLLDNVGPAGLIGVAGDYALARFTLDDSELTLARDAFGMRPLFWARSGRRIAWATDPEPLVRLGLARSELDPRAVSAFFSGVDAPAGVSPFREVRSVPPGSWVRFDRDGRARDGRWFRPEWLGKPSLSLEDAEEGLRNAVQQAIESRIRNQESVSINLSGGRDSGSIALAFGQLGGKATCITRTYDADLALDETVAARQVADRACLGWDTAFVPSDPSAEDLDSLPRLFRGPFAGYAYPEALYPAYAARDIGCRVALTGEGGEPLFSPPAVAVLDLTRRGRFGDALSAARGYHEDWIYPYRVTLKAIARALPSRRLIRARERLRQRPPWVRREDVADAPITTAPTSARSHLSDVLTRDSAFETELDTFMHRSLGLEVAHPFLDLRVVACVMQIPAEDQAPIDEPKPLLTRVFLHDLARSRQKVRFGAYYERLARNMLRTFPELVDPGRSLSAAAGLVRPGGIRAVADSRWLVDGLGLYALEQWMRHPLF